MFLAIFFRNFEWIKILKSSTLKELSNGILSESFGWGKVKFQGREVEDRTMMLLRDGRNGSRPSKAILTRYTYLFFKILNSKVIYTSRGFQRHIIWVIWMSRSQVFETEKWKIRQWRYWNAVEMAVGLPMPFSHVLLLCF